MPAAVRPDEHDESQHQDATASNKKLKTVLGLGSPSLKDTAEDAVASSGQKPKRSNTFARQSFDTAKRSYNQKKRNRQDRSSVTETDFFEPDAIVIASSDEHPIPTLENKMKTVNSNGTFRRPPVRMDAQDGPWSVSVAETPHDARSYSLYIKSEFRFSFTKCGLGAVWWTAFSLSYLLEMWYAVV